MNSAVKILEKSSSLFGEKIVYEDEFGKISFKELKELVQRVGQRLILSEENKNPIIVLIPKSIKCIVSYMGILYSGKAYVPVDSNIPLNRLEKIVDNLKPSGIITLKELELKIKNLKVKKYIYENLIEKIIINKELIEKRVSLVIDTDPAYIMYTSGSTGEPKGVTISHRSLIDYGNWVSRTFELNETTVMANQAPFYFDNSVFEIYGALISGGKVILIPEVLMMFPIKLPQFLEENNVNTIFWVPTILINIANSGVLSSSKLDKLKFIGFCGEIMPTRQLNIWRKEVPNCKYVNLYGPTEVTDVCSYYEIDRDFDDNEPIPIGKACINTRILIIKEDNTKAKENEIGEICVIGSCLSSGYWNNEELTKKVFIQNPLNKNYDERMYRTGDIGYINEEGLLIIKGRMDSQIKLKGNRIELGELEKWASCIEGVNRACALLNEEEEELVLFLETERDISLRKANIELTKNIPKYMQANKVYLLKKFPYTKNDKIDRISLRKNYF